MNTQGSFTLHIMERGCGFATVQFEGYNRNLPLFTCGNI